MLVKELLSAKRSPHLGGPLHNTPFQGINEKKKQQQQATVLAIWNWTTNGLERNQITTITTTSGASRDC